MGLEEREDVDTRLIAEPAFDAELQEAQTDLLDAFNAGTLTPEEAQRVRQAIAGNTAFARAAQMSAAFRLASRRSRFGAKSGSRFHVPEWAIAACGLVIAGGLVAGAVWRFRPAHSTSTVAPQNTAASAQPVSTVAPPPLSSPKTAATASRASTALMATLVMPESSRSGDAAVLEIKAGVEKVRVQWAVPADTGSRHRLDLMILRDAREVERTAETRPRRSIRGTPVAEFSVPASKLSPGTYLFRIAPSAETQEGQPPLVESAVEVKRS